MTGKRNLFGELIEGVAAMQAQREGKITLRTSAVEDLAPLRIDAALIRNTRERLNVSRAVFARRLRVAIRTLENWEQGRAAPNAQAAALILMVRQFPDTFDKLRALDNQAA
ncbi:MAG TPA: helix-turn-helix domain-containing protein [Lamprocystis sp. (in: g-proteobacteria)]|nr:helix-turn-helix domain-containing protein [Lamprocystis sp. (in: g-proteobacteria)]